MKSPSCKTSRALPKGHCFSWLFCSSMPETTYPIRVLHRGPQRRTDACFFLREESKTPAVLSFPIPKEERAELQHLSGDWNSAVASGAIFETPAFSLRRKTWGFGRHGYAEAAMAAMRLLWKNPIEFKVGETKRVLQKLEWNSLETWARIISFLLRVVRSQEDSL